MSITFAQFAEGWPVFKQAVAEAMRPMPVQPPQPGERDTCAQCGAGDDLLWTAYDRWQCVDLAGCAKRQLAQRP